MKRIFAIATAAAVVALSLVGGVTQQAQAETGALKHYVVVFKGDYALDGSFVMDATYALGPGYALGNHYALVHEYALGIIYALGGSVTSDLSKQIGVMVVASTNETFAQAMRQYALVDEVSEDYSWKASESYQEAVRNGSLTVVQPSGAAGGGADPTADPLEALQWNMDAIDAPEAHEIQAGSRAVEVGILDSGIDAQHHDFLVDSSGPNPNVDCAKGRDFVAIGPGVGNPDPCIDNQFHGTHVAGIVAAQSNGLGVVGVAPNVTLVPVKVCDTAGYCYASSTVAGITYAGDAKLEVINMSFFVDDDELLASTEFKCMSDAQQSVFRKANERAVQYARNQGVVPVAALGNSDNDLAASECDVVPAETAGVIGTMALGPENEKAYYSNYGAGATDVAAPGGNPEFAEETCVDEVLSTIPGAWGCFSGTSMASPHSAGVAALIVSQFGKVDSSGDVVLSPTSVESILQSTTIDQGLKGYDECFGNGRINALRAVKKVTAKSYDAGAPACPEYTE